ncbi:hypothetical protein EVAR_72713_1 [Eumeta japonica]|uniref:Uncharacterized protein n=1 Tax=Eumeta variegata TaxID=151549 RepID=A0A4C1SJC5_EUMVA|nr:hypothetical protein EVAR_72713_1 [Eumeta japonica]
MNSHLRRFVLTMFCDIRKIKRKSSPINTACRAGYRKAFYMDDYLQAFPDIETATRTIFEINEIHKAAAFQLRVGPVTSLTHCRDREPEKRAENSLDRRSYRTYARSHLENEIRHVEFSLILNCLAKCVTPCHTEGASRFRRRERRHIFRGSVLVRENQKPPLVVLVTVKVQVAPQTRLDTTRELQAAVMGCRLAFGQA